MIDVILQIYKNWWLRIDVIIGLPLAKVRKGTDGWLKLRQKRVPSLRLKSGTAPVTKSLLFREKEMGRLAYIPSLSSHCPIKENRQRISRGSW